MKQVLIFITISLLFAYINSMVMPVLIKPEVKCMNNTYFDKVSGKCIPTRTLKPLADAINNISNIWANITKGILCPPNQVRKCITTSFGKEICKCETTNVKLNNVTNVTNNLTNFLTNLTKTIVDILKRNSCPNTHVRECRTLSNGKEICICQKKKSKIDLINVLNNISNTTFNIFKGKICPSNYVRNCTTASNGKEICKCEKKNIFSEKLISVAKNFSDIITKYFSKK